MNDELGRRLMLVTVASIAMSFAACNGCNGCLGQTPDLDPPAVETASTATTSNTATPAGSATVPTPVVTSEATVRISPGQDSNRVAPCCQSIKDNLEVAPEKHRSVWRSALDKCNEALEKKLGSKGLEAVRQTLTPVGYPLSCQ